MASRKALLVLVLELGCIFVTIAEVSNTEASLQGFNYVLQKWLLAKNQGSGDVLSLTEMVKLGSSCGPTADHSIIKSLRHELLSTQSQVDALRLQIEELKNKQIETTKEVEILRKANKDQQMQNDRNTTEVLQLQIGVPLTEEQSLVLNIEVPQLQSGVPLTEEQSLVLNIELEEYNTTKKWGPLRRSLETVFCEKHAVVCGQLREISEDEETPLYRIGYSGYTELATYLLALGHVENMTDVDGENMLYGAVGRGDTSLAKMLLDSGANIDIKSNEWGSTPLIRAAHFKQLEAVKMLLENGADVNSYDIYHITALHFAAQEGQLDMVKLLVEAGAYTRAINEKGNTPFDLAASNGHTAVEEYLSQFPH